MPRQLSGGQKQRIGVARAFAGNAKVVVADEPVSALDVSVQAAVTELLMDIQRKNKTTMLFISHDLSVVRYIADRVVVMYLGHIVEQGTTDQIFSPPYHPYTEALLSAIPIADTSVVKKHIVLEGDIPVGDEPAVRLPVPDALPLQEAGAGQALRDAGAAGAAISATAIKSLCWLSDDVLATMEPVISFAKDKDDDSSRHGTPGAGPGFVGEPPRGRAARPRRRKPQPRAKVSRNPRHRRGCVVKIARRTVPRPVSAIRACETSDRWAGAVRSTTPTRHRRSKRRSRSARRTRPRRSAERGSAHEPHRVGIFAARLVMLRMGPDKSPAVQAHNLIQLPLMPIPKTAPTH